MPNQSQAAFTIFYNQGTQRYDLERTLQPDDQMWIDVGKLIREHVPDKNGTTLPANLSFGSYEIRDLTSKGAGSLFEGKVIYDKMYGHVTYGCAACCGYGLNPLFWYDPLGLPFGFPTDQGVDAADWCAGGALADVSDSFYNNWSTANPAIATVNAIGTHTGIAVGSTTSYTFGFLNNNDSRLKCPLQQKHPTGGDNVGPPDHLKILSDLFQSSSACPLTFRRLITYQSVDLNNNPVGTIQTKEQFASVSTNTCSSGTLNTTLTCTTDPNGIFRDVLFVDCNSVGGSCGITSTKQQWLWCPPGGGAAVIIATPGDLIVHNDSISVGGNTSGFSAGTCIYASGAISAVCIRA
jgi:hypothetical protein